MRSCSCSSLRQRGAYLKSGAPPLSLLEVWLASLAGLDGNKAMMVLAGVPVGPPRMPSKPVEGDDLAVLRSRVAAWCMNGVGGQSFDVYPKLCEATDAMRSSV